MIVGFDYQFSNPVRTHLFLMAYRCSTMNSASMKSGECPISAFIWGLDIISKRPPSLSLRLMARLSSTSLSATVNDLPFESVNRL